MGTVTGGDSRRRYRGACLPGPPDRVDERSVADDRLRQTRDDLNGEKIAFYGLSGSFAAPIVLAVEPRIKAAVLNVGGFWNARFLPEADPPTRAPRAGARADAQR